MLPWVVNYTVSQGEHVSRYAFDSDTYRVVVRCTGDGSRIFLGLSVIVFKRRSLGIGYADSAKHQYSYELFDHRYFLNCSGCRRAFYPCITSRSTGTIKRRAAPTETIMSGKMSRRMRQKRIPTVITSEASQPIVGISEAAAPPIAARRTSTNAYGVLKTANPIGTTAISTTALIKGTANESILRRVISSPGTAWS